MVGLAGVSRRSNVADVGCFPVVPLRRFVPAAVVIRVRT